VEQTDWISVVAFQGLVRSVERLGQGDLVGIEGRLRSRVYEKDGERRTAIEVVAGRIHFLRLMERGEEGSAEEGEECEGSEGYEEFHW
jgi:single-strand DNA-binding protein